MHELPPSFSHELTVKEKLHFLGPFFLCTFASLFRPASGFGSSGPVYVELVGLHRRSGVFFFFFGARGKKEHPLSSSPKQKGRRKLDRRLSGSQIRHQYV